MLQVNDYVVFGSTGVCQIAEIIEKSFSGMPAREYYVLRPVYGNNETVYLLPTTNRSISAGFTPKRKSSLDSGIAGHRMRVDRRRLTPENMFGRTAPLL